MSAAAAPLLTASRLTLDYETHVYRFDGRIVPGVTSVLQSAGLISYDGIPQDILDRAAARGKAVHLACEYLDLGTLDRASVDAELEPYVRAYERFTLDCGWQCGLVECRRYHAQRNYAGTLDRTGLIGSHDVLLDFKTTQQMQEGHFCQLAAYAQFFKNPRRFRLIGLQLKANATYQVHEVPPGRVDYYHSVFCSALTCAQFSHSYLERKN